MPIIDVGPVWQQVGVVIPSQCLETGSAVTLRDCFNRTCPMPSPAAALSYAERAQLFAQLGALEQAGVSVERALAIVQLRPQMQPRVAIMLRHLQQGRDLARAGQLAGLFSPLEVTLVQAAQSAGSPARLYQRLADGCLLYTSPSPRD